MAIDDTHKPTHILVAFTDVPESGYAQMLIRSTWEDKAVVDRAAAAMQLSQQQFIRTAVVRAAEKVLKETGK